jgi:DNA-directed RNA polymerase specialized sigma24 family protein
MDRDDALELLPPMYAVALRLVDAGAEPALIATAAGIELESVPAFVELARAKLAAVSDRPNPQRNLRR